MSSIENSLVKELPENISGTPLMLHFASKIWPWSLDMARMKPKNGWIWSISISMKVVNFSIKDGRLILKNCSFQVKTESLGSILPTSE